MRCPSTRARDDNRWGRARLAAARADGRVRRGLDRVLQDVEQGLHEQDVPEDLAIAALLHDVAEDAGGEQALNEISALFGERVAEIVDHCSDAKPEPGQSKAPWRERKEACRWCSASSAAPTPSPASRPRSCRTVTLAPTRTSGTPRGC